MKLTAKEIAEIVEGRLCADPGIIITGAAGLEEANSGDVSFLGNPKYIHLVSRTHAGIVLLPEKMPEVDRPSIKVKNPQLAFAKILCLIQKEHDILPKPGIHPAAVISKTARLGANLAIGPCVVIEDNAVIGDNTKIIANCYIGKNAVVGAECLIYPNVTIREGISIGNRVIINPGTVIGSDGYGFVPQENGHFKIPQIGIVEIGDDVEIGANSTIDRGTTGKTKIGSGTKIDNLVHIAHNVQLGKNCLILGQVGIAGSAKIGNFVTMASQSGAAGHLTIGDGATLAARAGVTTDIEPKEVVSGFPARPHREELKVQALIHKLPQIYEHFRKISKKADGK